MIGQQISHYRITGRIAEGGMGEVYAAQDLTLDRRVALKFLLPTQLVDEQAGKRLLREAQAAAGLDHPFVCKVYEVGEEAGRPFIAMEYVDGTTLKERIERERLPLDEVLRLASEIAEGVEAAHIKGIVHRDLKPANVMVGLNGHAKVMDFGVAKRLTRVGDNATATAIWADGETPGTLNYMSPEQLRGLPVDRRSDVFAFGVILYEMLTGTHPFVRANAMATAAAILNEPAPPLGPHLDQPQPVLEHIIAMALAKNPDKRHQSLHETRLELSAAGAPANRPPDVRVAWRSGRARRWLVGAVLVLAAAAGVERWGDRLPFGIFQPSLAFKERDWILIADVDNLTNDPVFDRSLRLALEVGIAQSKYVNVLPRDRLPGLLRQMQVQNVDRIDDTLAANIAVRDGHVRAVLGCTIAQIGNTYSLTARVIDPTTRVAVIVESAQANGKDHVLTALDDIVSRIRRKLGESLDGLTRNRVPLPSATTSSIEALKLYADSLRPRTAEGVSDDLLQQAIAVDPDFALAHAELGRRYYLNPDHDSRLEGEKHFAKAESLLDRLSARERLWIRASAEDARGNRELAAAAFTTYLAQYPDDATAWFRLGWTYMAGLSRYEPAIDAFNHVVALNPSESAAYVNLASCYSGLQQPQKALELYEKAFAFTPAFRTDVSINHEYGFTLVALGRIDEATRVFDQMKAASEPFKKARGSRSAALLDMYRGRYADAAAELRRAILIHQTNKVGVSEYRDRLILVRALQSRRLTSEATAELAAVDRLIPRLSLGPEWLGMAVRIRARRGDVADARRLLDAMIRTAGNATSDSAMNRNLQLDQPLITLAQGEIALAEGHPLKAVESFDAAHVSLKGAESLESLAAAYSAAGQFDDAAKRYEELLSHPPLGLEMQEDWLHAHVALALIREKQGRPDAARELYQRLLKIWKDADADAVLLAQARAGLART